MSLGLCTVAGEDVKDGRCLPFGDINGGAMHSPAGRMDDSETS